MDSIFKKIAEHYDTPIRIGSQCEANVFYRIEDLTVGDLNDITSYLCERTSEVCEPDCPDLVVHLPSCVTDLPNLIASNIVGDAKPLEIINSERIASAGGLTQSTLSQRIKGAKVIIVNDVITTARSCLELHTRLTIQGATVLGWVALIDRTFGPGPVPVIAAHTGEPVRLLESLS